jgi:hypothetical protein
MIATFAQGTPAPHSVISITSPMPNITATSDTAASTPRQVCERVAFTFIIAAGSRQELEALHRMCIVFVQYIA